MSTIINNLREKYPGNAIHTVAETSVEVYPDLTDYQFRSIGTLSPGQQAAVETVIILPERLFPDWWVWGSLVTDGTPK